MPERAEEIAIGFAGEQARFRLLWDLAPQTCAAIADLLPQAGQASHATCSGPAGVIFLETELPVGPENTSASPAVGELVFTYYPPGWRQGYPEHTSEIYWFYRPGGRPTVPGLFVPAMASVFAQHNGDPAELEALCAWTASLHREGWKPIALEAA